MIEEFVRGRGFGLICRLEKLAKLQAVTAARTRDFSGRVPSALEEPGTDIYPSGTCSRMGLAIALAGLALFVWSCVNYAQGKGYSPLVGLVGLEN